MPVLCHHQRQLRLLTYHMVLLIVDGRSAFMIVDVELVSSVELPVGWVKEPTALSSRVALVKLAASTERQTASMW
jgi:hypothetical protein